MNIDSPVSKIPLVGDSFSTKLQNLGIYTVKDFLYHIPNRFEDTANITPIGSIEHEGFYTVKGKLTYIENIYTKYGKKLTKATVVDESGAANILWFNQQYIIKSLPSLSDVLIYGKVSMEDKINPKFISPNYERLNLSETNNLGKLTPIYHETKGVTSKWMRSRIRFLLKNVKISDWLTNEILLKNNLIDIEKALTYIHTPKSDEEFRKGIERIAFDEMLLIQLFMEEKRNKQKTKSIKNLIKEESIYNEFLSSLPFTLTNSQKEVLEEIFDDLSKPIPMNRLLHGDVGSGKTVIAAAIIHQIISKGLKASIMAPTTILAKQHYNTFKDIFNNLGINDRVISLVTSDNEINLDAKVFIGTQALLFKLDLLKDMNLVVIDEQHRFGVNQREKLRLLEEKNPVHSLTMTATPIPRSLALTVYGDLDISYISELPKGRQIIDTKIVPQRKRSDLYEFIKTNIDNGRQAFIVCPLIEVSEKLDARAVEEEYDNLKVIFKKYKIALLHGQMKSSVKDKILEDFKLKKYDILLSTPVVEVGIDIPNANIMVIEGAERFGLAQLHQLRGRIGRGTHKSYCFLLTSRLDQENTKRLEIFSKNTSGIKIAEFDLENRGPGEVYGIKQSGISELKAAKLTDIELINTTKELSDKILTHGLDKYPSIKEEFSKFKKKIEKLD